MKKAILNILIVIVTIVLILGITYKVLTSPAGKSEEDREIEIPLGTGSSGIATILKENDLIKSKLGFKIYVKVHNESDFQAGTYTLNQSMTLEEIIAVLKTGKVEDPNQIKITYLEGKTMRWLANMIEEETNNTKEDVYRLLENERYIDSLIEKYWFIEEEIKNQNIYYSLEGYLFPDTYSLPNKDVTVEEIFEKMLDKMESILDPYKDDIKASKYSIHEILTIASVIEMEGINEADRADIASVLYNRLNVGMSLGSDVTTYYAVKVDMGERDLYQEEIETENPYNTRGPNMEGKLPVGPISSVGKESIEAAIKPSSTDYLFFVADKNRKVYFSKTNSEHEKIVQVLKTKGLWYVYE